MTIEKLVRIFTFISIICCSIYIVYSKKNQKNNRKKDCVFLKLVHLNYNCKWRYWRKPHILQMFFPIYARKICWNMPPLAANQSLCYIHYFNQLIVLSHRTLCLFSIQILLILIYLHQRRSSRVTTKLHAITNGHSTKYSTNLITQLWSLLKVNSEILV